MLRSSNCILLILIDCLILIKESNTRYPAILVVNYRTRITRVPAQTADQTIQVLCYAAINTLGISSNFDLNNSFIARLYIYILNRNIFYS